MEIVLERIGDRAPNFGDRVVLRRVEKVRAEHTTVHGVAAAPAEALFLAEATLE